MNGRIINSLSTATIALFFSHVLHESVHMFVAFAVGAEVRQFNLFAVDIELYNQLAYLWHDMAIEAGASMTNVLVGFLAVLVFYRIKPGYPLVKQFILQLSGYNLLMGFGYFLIDGLFYSPDMPGDWRSVITMLEGSVLLRVVLVLLGTAGMLFTMFWLARNVLVFVEYKQFVKERHKAVFPLFIIPYLSMGAIYTLFSIWHPLGFPVGLIITVLQFFFGFSGFLWAYFLSVHWLTVKQNTPFYGELPDRVNPLWCIAAIIILLFKALVLLPTIQLA